MTWKDEVLACIIELTDKKGTFEFNLEDLYAYSANLSSKYPENNFIEEKIRQQLQYLRDDNIIIFKDNQGSYTLNILPSSFQ